jgi:hypothetical protein
VVIQTFPTVVVNWYLWDVWAADPSQHFVAFLGSEPPTTWKPRNWIQQYPYLLVDGVLYFYP